jgi:8-oxo-dGTP pyrophosphatase MutT (NUDIX family)
VIEQAGVLAYRLQDDAVQILLVRSRQDTHWTIPKGTPDDGTTLQQTAAQEALQEGGVRGVPGSSPVGSYDYTKKGKRHRVVVFPLLVEEELSTWPEQFRERQWCDAEVASSLVTADGLGELIRGFRPLAPQGCRETSQQRKCGCPRRCSPHRDRREAAVADMRGWENMARCADRETSYRLS